MPAFFLHHDLPATVVARNWFGHWVPTDEDGPFEFFGYLSEVNVDATDVLNPEHATRTTSWRSADYTRFESHTGP